MTMALNTRALSDALPRKGLIPARVAQRLGVSREAVSKWLRGESMPTPDKLLRLGVLLGMTFDELVITTAPDAAPIIWAGRGSSGKKTDAPARHAADSKAKRVSARDLYLIAGSNGAGKTTFAREFLPDYAHCVHFINPDLIAAGLSPFDPSAAALEAGRLVLREVQRAIHAGKSFAFESTLSGRTYLHHLREAKGAGFALHVFYLWIPGTELALARIRERVKMGGHNVPEPDVRRRYSRSLQNLFTLYAPEADSVHFFDNSGSEPRLIFRVETGALTVLDEVLYSVLQRQVSI